jgi:hypothetical protein
LLDNSITIKGNYVIPLATRCLNKNDMVKKGVRRQQKTKSSQLRTPHIFNDWTVEFSYFHKDDEFEQSHVLSMDDEVMP